MEEVYKIIIGIGGLALGIPIGNMLAKATKEELRTGKVWFILIIIASLIGSGLSFYFKNNWLLFGFLFIAAVTSMSLRRRDN